MSPFLRAVKIFYSFVFLAIAVSCGYLWYTTEFAHNDWRDSTLQGITIVAALIGVGFACEAGESNAI